MGWSGGSSLMGEVIKSLKKAHVGVTQREEIYKHLIEAFENEDCDTLDECLDRDPAFKRVFQQIHAGDSDYDW